MIENFDNDDGALWAGRGVQTRGGREMISPLCLTHVVWCFYVVVYFGKLGASAMNCFNSLNQMFPTFQAVHELPLDSNGAEK